MIARIFAFLLFGLCLWSGILQYNDPDTLIWVIIYALPGIVALLYGLKIKHRGVLLGIALIYLVGSIYWYPHPWPANWVDHEEAREFGGLAIIAVSFGILGLITSLRRDL